MKSIAPVAWTILTALAVVEASTTTVTVLEFGKTGTVRRTQATNPETSVEGVVSFWKSLHLGGSDQIQHAGMTVVPDLFRKPESGVVVGISGSSASLDSLEIFSIEEKVGFLEVEGKRCSMLMKSVPEFDQVSVESLAKSAVEQGKKNGLTGVKTTVDEETTPALKTQISSMIYEFKALAKETGETVVVHFIVEDDASISRQRRLSRQLDDQAANAENVEDDGEQNTFYGYGYYNSNGVYVTRYKSMFQIQYFNVVLWTSIGLVLAIFYAIYLMVFMPLEADTLLFGESAKLVGDE